jgi:outer membrane protein
MTAKTVGFAAAYAVGVATLVLAQTPGGGAPAQAKVGVMHIQDAIIRTKEGQKTAKEMQGKYSPRQEALDKQRRELEDLQAQLNKGRNTMSQDAQNNLVRQIDQKNRALQRDSEDASAEWQQEEGKVINAIGQKMMAIIDKYAKERGYSIILDISSPQSPVLFAVNTVDITNDIVELYDKAHGEGGAGPSAGSPVAAPPAGGVRKAPVAPPPAPKTAPVPAPKTSPAPKQ